MRVITVMGCLLMLGGAPSLVGGNFNLFMDKQEVYNLLGLSSEIYLVREGVVNDYALNFVVNIPSHIQHLHFKWQTSTKRVVHYEMMIEFRDFFALLQPSSNISNVGRLPQKLESFRISLPCSGRISTEVAVMIKFTFSVKHNLTHVNLKRNKICLLKGAVENHHKKIPKEKRLLSPSQPVEPPQSPPMGNISMISAPSDPDMPPSPSMVLAGLLGACAVTASTASVIFLICLRRKLKLQFNCVDKNLSEDSMTGGNSESEGAYCSQKGSSQNFSSTNGSPACLLQRERRQSTPNWNKSKDPNPKENYIKDTNSYVKFTSFWSDILEPRQNNSLPSPSVPPPPISQPPQTTAYDHSKKPSDVSPYAYVQVMNRVPPWYSQSGHIYVNHLTSFGASNNGESEKLKFSPPTQGRVQGEEGGYENFGGQSVASLIQIDGFQCSKSYAKDANNVIERFL